MPAGISILNDFGTVLIDDSNPSLALRNKFTASAGSNNVGYVDIYGETPVVAVHSPTVYMLRPNYTQQAGFKRYSFGPEKVELGPSPAYSVPVYVFDRPVDSGQNAGLKIYDAQGRLTFDALGKYGRVAGILNGYGSQIFYGQPGRTYACVVLGFTYIEELIADPISPSTHRRQQVWTTGFRQDGNNVIMKNCLITDLRYPSTVPTTYRETGSTPRIVVLDVTGY